MAKFKVGDRVRCTEDQSGRGKGCLGVVVVSHAASVDVDFDAPFEGWGESGRMWAVADDDLELVTEEAKPAYKVGDKVRCLVEQFDVTRGAMYRVARVEGGDVWIVDDVGDDCYMRQDEIEPADAPAAMKFKVGDHVVGESNIGGPVDGIIDRVDDEDVRQPYRVDGLWCYAKDLQLAETQPPPLTIRAGGYYKTRDGRRVGPMERGGGYADSSAYWRAPDLCDGYSPIWYKDGRFYEKAGHGNDIVAEWPAAKGCAAAQVDVQREEYGAPAVFRVGDLVRAISDLPEGRTGRVIFIDGNGTASGDYLVEFQDWGGGHNGSRAGRKVSGNNCWWLSIADMERVDTTTGPAIVALIEGGQPKPATRPYVHANRDLAAKEAARLADVNKGQEFGVYELVTTRKVERTYEHEWQRLAAAGQKINAIINLRKIADINLKAAKDAVESFLDAA